MDDRTFADLSIAGVEDVILMAQDTLGLNLRFGSDRSAARDGSSGAPHGESSFRGSDEQRQPKQTYSDVSVRTVINSTILIVLYNSLEPE